MIYIIGCGGAGSWLLPKLAKLTREITLIDGDTLEHKNLDRQLFKQEDIGDNKAQALRRLYGMDLKAIPHYFSASMQLDLTAADYIFGCVDNHPARRNILMSCDQYGCSAIIAANEYTDAEAYYYNKEMQNTPNDPRILYPNINTDRHDDPLGPPGCTGEAAIASPQLVLANDWASGLALHLYWWYEKECLNMKKDTKQYWPIHHQINKFKTYTIRYGDRLNAKPN